MAYEAPGRRILVAEDDEHVARWLKQVFKADGHTVDIASDGAIALNCAITNPYDLLVVDLNLPERDGMSVVREVRRQGRDMPVLILTGSGSDEDVANGLDAGADDFITKPVSMQVLRARANAAMRRASPSDRHMLGFGDVSIDRSTFKASGPLGVALLTAKEFSLLQFMLNHAAQVVPREKLLLNIWGYDFDPGTNVLEVALSRLRNRLTEITNTLRLKTLRGQGVVLESAIPETPGIIAQ